MNRGNEDHYDFILEHLRAAIEVEWHNQSQAPPPTVYHYTTPTAFAGIVNSRRLWGTISSKLIDFKELLHAQELLQSVLRRRAIEAVHPQYSILYPPQVTEFEFARSDITQIFVASLTAAEDDLAQWDRYADRFYGVALGFNTQALVDWSNATAIAQPVTFAQVDYDLNRQRAFFELFVDAWEHEAATAVTRELHRVANPIMYIAAWLGNLASCACAILPRMKTSQFAVEREWRLIHGHVADVPQDCVVVDDANSKPHVELDLTQLSDDLPLSTLWLGPGIANDESELVARTFLDARGLANVTIHRSTIPLRIEQRVLSI